MPTFLNLNGILHLKVLFLYIMLIYDILVFCLDFVYGLKHSDFLCIS